MTDIGSNSNAQLRSVVERIERLGAEIKEMRDDQNEIYAEAKSSGYDVKVLRKIIAIRKKDPAARAEEATLLDTYMTALGMQV